MNESAIPSLAVLELLMGRWLYSKSIERIVEHVDSLKKTCVACFMSWVILEIGFAGLSAVPSQFCRMKNLKNIYNEDIASHKPLTVIGESSVWLKSRSTPSRSHMSI